jgi:NADPH:quinone reductase-like Zn-dependent oxidoreductase
MPIQAVKAETIPLFDGAGEIVATGDGVTRWKQGDRVVSSFSRDWIDGRFLPTHMQTALDGGIDGVLSEYRAFPEHGLASLPPHRSWEQGTTLPCAALTAWHAPFEKTPLLPRETVPVSGTGGVSLFAPQFGRMAGASVLATSSGDAKLERMKTLGASALVNYRAQTQ